MTGTAGFWGNAMDSLPGDGGHHPSCIHDHHDMKHLEPLELPGMPYQDLQDPQDRKTLLWISLDDRNQFQPVWWISIIFEVPILENSHGRKM